jgi:hypothetical protein
VESDPGKAIRYLQRAEQLKRIARAIQDEESRRILSQVAEDYVAMAEALTTHPKP